MSLKVQRKGDPYFKSQKVAEERAMAPWVLSPPGKRGSGRQSASSLSANPLGNLSVCGDAVPVHTPLLLPRKWQSAPVSSPSSPSMVTGMKVNHFSVLWDALCCHVPTLKLYTSEPRVVTVFADRSYRAGSI